MSQRHQRGFSLAELLVTAAIIGVIMVAVAPQFYNYFFAAATKAAARELTAVLNRGRQLAITRNGQVCIRTNSTDHVRFELGCGSGVFWTGLGTDGQGWMTITNEIRLIGPNPAVAFTNLGAAAPAGVFTLQNPTDGQTLTVTVAASGRITIP